MLLLDDTINAALDAIVDEWDGLSMKVYTGPAPATLAAAASGTLLVTLTFDTPAFGAASGGVATAETVDPQNGVATGVMGYLRIYDGATCVAQCVVGQAFEVTGWVKVSDTEATCNLPSGHGLSSGAGFSVAWSGGGRMLCHAEISTNAVILRGGVGYALPASATTGVMLGQGDVLVDDADVSAAVTVGIDLLTVEFPAC